MQIIEKNLKEIRPYEKNPRRNDGAVDAVAASIKEFGFKVPIVIDGAGVIVCGHTRYKAAKKLKMQTVPCVVADDLTDEQIKAFRLSDNKTGELAQWDFEQLEAELDAIMEIDMNVFGFCDIEKIEQYTNVKSGGEIDPSEYDENKFECECPRCGFHFNKS